MKQNAILGMYSANSIAKLMKTYGSSKIVHQLSKVCSTLVPIGITAVPSPSVGGKDLQSIRGEGWPIT
jgi:hypothetical protein